MALMDESGFLSLLAEAKQKLVAARAMAHEAGDRALAERVEDALKAIQTAEQWVTRASFFEHPEQRAHLSAEELRRQLRALEAQVSEQAPTGLERDALQRQIAAIEDELYRRDEPV